MPRFIRNLRCTTKDARWFNRQEIESVLSHKEDSHCSRDEYKKMGIKNDERWNTEQTNEGKPIVHAHGPSEFGVEAARAQGQEEETVMGHNEPPFKLPPETSITGMLIRDWVARKDGFPSKISKSGSAS